MSKLEIQASHNRYSAVYGDPEATAQDRVEAALEVLGLWEAEALSYHPSSNAYQQATLAIRNWERILDGHVARAKADANRPTEVLAKLREEGAGAELAALPVAPEAVCEHVETICRECQSDWSFDWDLQSTL